MIGYDCVIEIYIFNIELGRLFLGVYLYCRLYFIVIVNIFLFMLLILFNEL